MYCRIGNPFTRTYKLGKQIILTCLYNYLLEGTKFHSMTTDTKSDLLLPFLITKPNVTELIASDNKS